MCTYYVLCTCILASQINPHTTKHSGSIEKHYFAECDYIAIIYGISYYYSSDINECHERRDGCRQECINTNGSYYCACRPGYRLLADGYTCIGKLEPF